MRRCVLAVTVFLGGCAATVQFVVPEHDRMVGHLQQATALVQVQKPDEALVHAQTVINHYEQQYKNTARVIYCAGSRVETAFYARNERALVLDNVWSQAWFVKGWALAEKKNYPQALEALQRAAQLSPQNVTYLLELGFAQQLQRRPREAIASFRRGLDAADLADPAERNKLRAKALRGAGFNQIDVGELDEAEISIRGSLELDPDDVHASNELEFIKQLRSELRAGHVPLTLPAPAPR